jgi:hypothetical protein
MTLVIGAADLIRRTRRRQVRRLAEAQRIPVAILDGDLVNALAMENRCQIAEFQEVVGGKGGRQLGRQLTW